MTAPTFLRLPSGNYLNLAAVTYVYLDPGPEDASRLEVTAGADEYVFRGPDAALLRAALDAFAWRPAGGPGLLGSEALALVRELVERFDRQGRQPESLPDDGLELLFRCRALLARAAGGEAPADVSEGDPD